MMKGIIVPFAILWGCYGGVFGAITNNVTVEGLGNAIGSLNYTTWTNRTIYSFRNIPYAQAPVGDLRFRPPVKVTTWNGTLDATEFGSECPYDNGTSLDEDCLKLNVFVPEVNDTATSLPVMFYIYGGAFEMSLASPIGPNYLLEEDVILVTVQFRVGPLGLLCLHTDDVPGNMMFLDQLMAMQWVQDNIGYFGGDKERVTLLGHSSGGAAVNLHIVSPLSKGLFHQAALLSASALDPWLFDNDPVTSSTEIAASMGCNTTDVSSITACMKTAPVQEILTAFRKRHSAMLLEGWSPGGNRAVVQQAGVLKFLTDKPYNLVKKGNFTQVPLIGLVTKNEGLMDMTALYESLLVPYSLWNNTEYMQRNFTTYVLNATGIDDSNGAITDELINTYFSNGELGNYSAMVPGLTDIFSSFKFKAGVYQMVKYNSFYQNKTYLCSFDYLVSTSQPNSDSSYPIPNGVSHGADVEFVFATTDSQYFSDDDKAVSTTMIQLMTSFVKNGQPIADGVEWPAVSTQFGPYLKIDTTPTIGYNFLDEYTVMTRELAATN